MLDCCREARAKAVGSGWECRVCGACGGTSTLWDVLESPADLSTSAPAGQPDPRYHAPITAADIVAALHTFWAHADSVIALDELRVGTGYGKDADQRIDFWAMQAIPSKRFRRVAYEIKVSRADFLNELKQPRKRARALLLSNEFYFVTLPGIVKAGELPPEAGLIETGERWRGNLELTTKHPAPWRDGYPPTWQFLAAIARRAGLEQKQ